MLSWAWKMFYILSARFSNHMVFVLIHVTEKFRTFNIYFWRSKDSSLGIALKGYCGKKASWMFSEITFVVLLTFSLSLKQFTLSLQWYPFLILLQNIILCAFPLDYIILCNTKPFACCRKNMHLKMPSAACTCKCLHQGLILAYRQTARPS